MKLIKVIYDNGSNGLVKVARRGRKSKRIAEMSSKEIINCCFGLFR